MMWEEKYAGRLKLMQSAIAELLALAERPEVISFAGGLPDPKVFNIQGVSEIAREVLMKEGDMALQYSPSPGYAKLRTWMCERMQQVEKVSLTREEIMITTGGIDAFNLVCKVFLEPGDVVITGAPTYLGSLGVIDSYEAKAVGVSLDDEGMNTDELEQTLKNLYDRGIKPKFIYEIPNFHNPAGVSLSPARRKRLVELSKEFSVPIVEDDAYGELIFEGERPLAMKALAPEQVIFIGTFSKIMAPGLRLGWIAAPAPVIEKLVLAKQTTDQCSSALIQRIVYEYGRRGMIEEQVARSIRIYRAKAEKTFAAIEKYFPGNVTWTKAKGGFYSWVTLPEGHDTQEMLVRAIKEDNVAFVPGAPFYPDKSGKNRFRLCYSLVDIEKIDEGIRRMAEVIKKELQRDWVG